MCDLHLKVNGSALVYELFLESFYEKKKKLFIFPN